VKNSFFGTIAFPNFYVPSTVLTHKMFCFVPHEFIAFNWAAEGGKWISSHVHGKRFRKGSDLPKACYELSLGQRRTAFALRQAQGAVFRSANPSAQPRYFADELR
jgi:hypothetical protein